MSEIDPKLSHIILRIPDAFVVAFQGCRVQLRKVLSEWLLVHGPVADCCPLHTQHEFVAYSYFGRDPGDSSHFGVTGAWGVGVLYSGRAWGAARVVRQPIRVALPLLTCTPEVDRTSAAVKEPVGGGRVKLVVRDWN